MVGFFKLESIKLNYTLLNVERSIQLAQEISQLNIRTVNISLFDEIKVEKRLFNTPKTKYFELVLVFAKFQNLNHFTLYIDEFVFLKKIIMRKLKKLVFLKFDF
ncbi:hypothetical protein ABPG72_022153 [Tetrahymena utriculariae]